MLESETAQGLLYSSQRKKEGASGGMEAFQVCSFISIIRSPGRREGRKDSAAGQDPPAPARDGGCVSRDAVTAHAAEASSSPRVAHSPSPRGTEKQLLSPIFPGIPSPTSNSFLLFPGHPFCLVAFKRGFLDGSDIQDRREKSLCSF